MVALFVVAIVSTPLLQMFVTTSYVNKAAQVMDMANVIAVQQAETFKADPVGYSSSNGDTSYHFYKGDGTPINPTSVYHELTDTPDGAAIMIKSDFPDPTPTVTPSINTEAGYYPDFVGTIDLSHYDSDLDVTITNFNEISTMPALSTFDSSKIKNYIIPIRVDFEGIPRTISVLNNSDLEAEFYIFNTDNGSDVTLKTLQGYSSIAYVPTTSTSYDEDYDLTLTVNRLNKGVWVELFTYSVNRHIYY